MKATKLTQMLLMQKRQTKMAADARLIWTLLAPLVAGAVAAVLLLIQTRKGLKQRYVLWLRLAALAVVTAGLGVEVILIVTDEGSAKLGALGTTLTISSPARLVLVAANVALFCAAITAWTVESDVYSPGPEWGLLLSLVMSSALAGAGMVEDPAVVALLLLAAGLVVGALALARPGVPVRAIDNGEDEGNLRAHTLLARRMAGGLKAIGLSTLAVAALLVGAVLVGRYAFNLENRGLLQLGLALLAIGIVVRASSMPFSAASGDLVQASPSAALMTLGAGTPVVLVAGLLMLAPIEGSLAHAAAAGWLGAVGTLLAGLRALGVLLERQQKPEAASSDDSATPARWNRDEANLIAMTAAAATGWAIFGILSGSRMGAIGAVLIAANVGLALPLAIMGRRWSAVGVLSLLGLPPFGGFVGTLLVAGSAVNEGGLWLAVLLVGSALVGAGWLSIAGRNKSTATADGVSSPTGRGWRRWLADPALLLTTFLAAAQIVMFAASFWLASELDKWANVAWLTGP
jgi:hypothetical protein